MADRAIASENDAKDNSVRVAEVRVNDSEKLIGIMEDISIRLKKLETSGHQKKHYNMAANNNSNENNDKNVVTTKVLNYCLPAPPPTGTAQPTATDDALICYYHQRFGDKARLCRDPCAFALNC